MFQILSDALRLKARPRRVRRIARRVAPESGHPSPASRQLLAALPGTVIEADGDEAPIFLLSAGWRSGSTLLQRLLMSDKNGC
jgi:hypothetical protein